MKSNDYICGIPWIMNPEDETFMQKAVPLLVLNVFLAIVAISMNILAIRGLWNLENIPYGTRVLLLNLCMADLGTGLFTQPSYMALLGLQLKGKTLCPLVKTIDLIAVFLCLSSFSTVIAATFERYVSIFHPYFHQRLTLGSKPKIIVIIIWAFAVICTGLLVEGIKKHSLLIWIVWNIMGFCWIIFAYTKIYFLACQLRNRIRTQERRFCNNNSSDKKSTNIVAGLAFLSVGCYLPFIAVQCVRFATRSKILNSEVDQYLWTLQAANSAINPTFYCLLNKAVRKSIFRAWKIRRNTPPELSMRTVSPQNLQKIQTSSTGIN